MQGPRSHKRVVTVALACLSLTLSCRSRASGAAPAPADWSTTAPAAPPAASAPAVAIFKSDRYHIELHYPGNWVPRHSADYVLLLAAPGSGDPPVRTLSVDLPDLPPHIPGMIPLSLVVNGYVDDLKKQHPGLRVEESSDQMIAGLKARRVRTAWRAGDTTDHEVAVLAIHGDHVHILRADSDDPGLADDLAAFDMMIRSLQFK